MVLHPAEGIRREMRPLQLRNLVALWLLSKEAAMQQHLDSPQSDASRVCAMLSHHPNDASAFSALGLDPA